MNAVAQASAFAAARPVGFDPAFVKSTDLKTAFADPVAALLQSLAAGASSFEQGALLRALDGVTGGRQSTDALLRGDATVPAQTAPGKATKTTAPAYTDKTLYAAGGPKASDIRQDAMGDCYFVATLAAVAQERPQAIRNAISFDAKTSTFSVKLYDSAGKAQTIRVTQAEIANNVKRQGGSTMDNTGKTGPSWPAVMETAYAKMHDSNPKNGLNEGYKAIVNGGWPADAMRAVTGNAGTEAKFSQGLFETRGAALDRYGSQIDAALKADKPVTAWSVPERDSRGIIDKLMGGAIPQDGLADNHVYSVQSISKDARGDWQVTLRNPWSHNVGVGEGKDVAAATIVVPLDTLVSTGGLESFRIGK